MVPKAYAKARSQIAPTTQKTAPRMSIWAACDPWAGWINWGKEGQVEDHHFWVAQANK